VTETEKLRASIGRELRGWRTASGKSLRDVEADFGKKLNKSHLSQLENGKAPSPRLETFYDLARFYGISLHRTVESLAMIFPPTTPED